MAPEAARGRGYQLTGSTGCFLEPGSGGTPADASPVRPVVHFTPAEMRALTYGAVFFPWGR